VDDAEKFKKELQSLDVPADKVRHPVVFGPLSLSASLTLRDVRLLKTITDKPIKAALPGPYLLSRIMWLECIADKAYDSRESLAKDIVRVLREETHRLLAEGVSLVQFDEPVLTEVVFTGPKNDRSFMCGALSERGNKDEELGFAIKLINEVVQDLPRERLAVHICRGNWTPDESVALTGSYEPLLPVLTSINVGTLFLEFCTERAGSLDVLKELKVETKIGVGLVNPKNTNVEDADEILKKAERAVCLLGAERVYLNPDCGFATFADSPVTSQEIAVEKLKRLSEVALSLRQRL
jgi:5-methyltetrahydropteroyltriglutamate--homocysteine methyltransferase